MDRGMTRFGHAGLHSKGSVLFQYKQYAFGRQTPRCKPCGAPLLIGSVPASKQTPAIMSRAKAALLLLLLVFAAGRGEQEAAGADVPPADRLAAHNP